MPVARRFGKTGATFPCQKPGYSCRKPGLTVPFARDFGKAGPTALLCRKDLQCRRPGLVCPGFWQCSAVDPSLPKTRRRTQCNSPRISARLDLRHLFAEKTSSAVGPGWPGLRVFGTDDFLGTEGFSAYQQSQKFLP